ncbi:MAG: shikimate kinase [Candidatus Roizmanbacteria bacterium]
MINRYKSIILIGPWLSGKSTISRELAKKLSWQNHEMDEIITKQSGKTITEITQNGTMWSSFRQLELNLLISLLKQTNIIISSGGGVGVNDIAIADNNKTYGQRERELLLNNNTFLKIVLLPSIEVFLNRIKESEENNFDTMRPILNEEKAIEINNQINRTDKEEIKQIYLQTKLKVAEDTYKKRLSLYKLLSPHHIDTGLLSIDEVVTTISDLL